MLLIGDIYRACTLLRFVGEYGSSANLHLLPEIKKSFNYDVNAKDDAISK